MENTKSERAAVKRCSKCGEEKPVDHFYKKLAAPDGLQAQCRVCLDMYRKKRRERLELAANTPQSRGGGASSDPAETRRQAGDASAPTQKAERETLFLTIDFTGHRSLLDRITSIAEIEDRTPEMQARYFLRTCLGREYEQ